MSDNPIEGRPQGALANVRRRIYLTYRYFGLRTLLFRAITLPLRFTPLQRRMRLRTHARDQELRSAVAWYRQHGRPVDIVIPSYRDAERVHELVRSIDKTVATGMARVIVVDDASGPEHVAALRAIKGIDVLIEGEQNEGFAANANRGLRASDPERDVIVLNSDIEALPGWLECLQYATARYRDIGIVGAQLQYPGMRRSGSTIATGSSPPAGVPPAGAAPRSRSPARACTCGGSSSSASACSTSATRWHMRTSTGACAPGRRAFACCTFPPPSSFTTSR